jgi:hypothetical protein
MHGLTDHRLRPARQPDVDRGQVHQRKATPRGAPEAIDGRSKGVALDATDLNPWRQDSISVVQRSDGLSPATAHCDPLVAAGDARILVQLTHPDRDGPRGLGDGPAHRPCNPIDDARRHAVVRIVLQRGPGIQVSQLMHLHWTVQAQAYHHRTGPD